MSGHVFISHASADAAAAQALVQRLERRGLKAWIAPRDIQPAGNYPDEIVRGIDTAAAIVVVLTEAANASKFVAREVEMADRKNLPVIPYRLRAVEPGPALALFLNNKQWIDAFALDDASAIEAVAAAAAGPVAPDAHAVPFNSKPTATYIWPKLGRSRQLLIAAGLGMAALLAAYVAGLGDWILPGRQPMTDPDKVLDAIASALVKDDAATLFDAYASKQVQTVLKRADAIASLVPVTTTFGSAKAGVTRLMSGPLSARSVDQAAGDYHYGWLGAELANGTYACALLTLERKAEPEAWGFRNLNAWGPFTTPCLDKAATAEGVAATDRIVGQFVTGTLSESIMSDAIRAMPQDQVKTYVTTFSELAKSFDKPRRLAVGPLGLQQPGFPPQQVVVARYAFDNPGLGQRMNADFWVIKTSAGVWQLVSLPRPLTQATAP